MIRDYIWIVHYVDQADGEEKVRFVSALNVYRAEIRASKIFLQPIKGIHCIGGYRTMDDARAAAEILYPELLEEEIV